MSSNNSFPDIPEKPIPPGVKTAGMKLKEEYNQAVKDGRIDPPTQQNNNNNINTPKVAAATNQNQIRKDPEEEKRLKIIEYLAHKTSYNIWVNDGIKEYKRILPHPKQHFELFKLTQFHNKILLEINAIERRKVLINAQIIIIGRSLSSEENLKKYDQLLDQLDALTERANNLSWKYNDQVFDNHVDFADYLYMKVLEYCIGMTNEEYNLSAMSSSQELINQYDAWGTRHIADACLEVEQKTYSYFQIPSKSLSES